MARLSGHWYFRGLALICSVALAPGEALLYGQSAPQSPQAGKQENQFMSPEQLNSLVSPIALYPDSLLAQVLAAATYPLQIVAAQRWVQENSKLKGKDLLVAAGKQDWDPSIQALVAFPTVLQMMDQSLEWTTALGNVFLAQQADLMAAVQRMRAKAQQSGKLESNEQQTVQATVLEGQSTIVIQPADPEVIYVPSYDPVVVYGAAPEYYPYPAIPYYPTGAVAASAISFGVGVAVGAIFNGCCGGGWGWGWGCNWGAHPSLYVNNNFFNHNGNTFVNRGNWGNNYRGNGQLGWNHNPRYRGAVPYANRDVANRFNGGQGGLRPAQQPANIGNIRPPGSQGSANRLPGNAGINQGLGGRPDAGHLPGNAGANRPSQLPGNAGANRPGQLPENAGANRPSQLPANVGANRPGGTPGSTGSASRVSGGSQFGGWGGSNPSISNRGGAFGGGSAAQARSSSSRGFSSMGGFHGGGGFRGGGGRRR